MTDKFEYILIKDPHFKWNFKNSIRKPGWEKKMDDKIYQVISYMKEKKIKNLFFTGDVFDKSKISSWSFSQFQANMKRLRYFKDAGITVYSNLGNHDLSNGGRENIKDTIFAAAIDLGLLTYIGTGMEPIRFEAGVGEVLLFGVDYHVSIDKVIDEIKRVGDYPRGQQSVKICLTHSNITADTEKLSDLTYGQLSVYDIDTIGCGHYHICPKDGAIQELNRTTFLNPWNFSRESRDYFSKLDEHKPEFIHAEIYFVPNADPHFHYEEIFLDVGKFSETFHVDIINLLQELGKSKFGFFDEVGEDLEQDEDMSDDAVLLHNLAKTYEISEESIKIAKELIS